MWIPIYELPSLRSGFYKVFNDKNKIIFNNCYYFIIIYFSADSWSISQQNRRQKVFNRGALSFYGGSDILNIDNNSTDYSVSPFNLGELGTLFGGVAPTKTPWRRDCSQAQSNTTRAQKWLVVTRVPKANKVKIFLSFEKLLNVHKPNFTLIPWATPKLLGQKKWKFIIR